MEIQNRIENSLKDGYVTVNQLSKKLKISEKCVRRYLKRMVELNLVNQKAPDLVEIDGKPVFEYKGYGYRWKKLSNQG